MAKMKKGLLIFFSGLLWVTNVQALEVKHSLKTTIGFFDACETMFTYAFYNNKDYDIKTSITTSGAFGVLYPFTAAYHAVGTYDKFKFKPQDYFYETQTRFRHRSKEIVYKNGEPQYRVSVKNEHRRTDKIKTNPQYPFSGDLLSVFGELTQRIITKGKCDLEQYSFNGKKYAKSVVKTLKKEKIKTEYFSGKALKCQYTQEILEDTDAGFLLNPDEPIYFWVLRDEKTKAWFVAKILIENTPFGKLQAVTTNIEVK